MWPLTASDWSTWPRSVLWLADVSLSSSGLERGWAGDNPPSLWPLLVNITLCLPGIITLHLAAYPKSEIHKENLKCKTISVEWFNSRMATSHPTFHKLFTERACNVLKNFFSLSKFLKVILKWLELWDQLKFFNFYLTTVTLLQSQCSSDAEYKVYSLGQFSSVGQFSGDECIFRLRSLLQSWYRSRERENLLITSRLHWLSPSSVRFC